MTDKEIIEALNCHSDKKIVKCRDCGYADYFGQCVGLVCEDALDLIKRQQAEIDRLTKYNTDVAFKHYDDGIKEFAERLIAMLAKYDMYGTLYIIEDIENLAKETVGADNG